MSTTIGLIIAVGLLFMIEFLRFSAIESLYNITDSQSKRISLLSFNIDALITKLNNITLELENLQETVQILKETNNYLRDRIDYLSPNRCVYDPKTHDKNISS